MRWREGLTKKSYTALALIFCLSIVSGCSRSSERGIADRRSDFKRFIAMEGDPSRYGLRAVRPYFKQANRTQILRAIETACKGSKEGSSDYNPTTKAGYYINCNPRNRQLLNGYVPSDARKRPRSGRESTTGSLGP